MLPGLVEKIGKYGWLDIDAVSIAVKDWLRSDAPATRTQALMVIADLRLGDFVKSIQSTLDRGSTCENENGAAREAARALGIAFDE